MANSPQAIKRIRQANRRATQNRAQRSSMRTTIKKLLKALAEQQPKDTLQTYYRTAASYIDHMAGKGLIHANRAARLKSRLNKRVKAAHSE